MVDKKQMEDSVKQMLAGLEGLVQFTEQSTKGMFENMGKTEAKRFAKAMQQMKFSENIVNLKNEVEDLKKSFNKMK